MTPMTRTAPTFSDVDAHQLTVALDIIRAFHRLYGIGVHMSQWTAGTTDLRLRVSLGKERGYANGASVEREWTDGTPALTASDLADMESEAWHAACKHAEETAQEGGAS